MYCVFIDFSKAFDRVKHSLLFYRLISYGLHGRVLTTLRSMYNDIESCVLCNGGLTEYFDCTIGTRQGCMLSPLLFSLFVNELASYMDKHDNGGICVTNDFTNMGILMYADDVADVSDMPILLQRKLNQLEQFCDHWGMAVNLEKTKIVVFRNGGVLRSYENWSYKGTPVEVVKHYNYLGLLFSSKLSWTPTRENLAAKGKRALYQIQVVIKKLGGLPISEAF